MIARLLCASLFLLAALQSADAKDPGKVNEPGSPAAEEVGALLRRAASAEAQANVAEALHLYEQANARSGPDPFILQKLAKQCSDLISDERDPQKARALAEQSLAYSERAVALAPRDPVCVLSLAISCGKLAVLSDANRKIEYARRVRKHSEEALALKPDYDWAHHVLGRWHCEVAQVGGPTRALARLFFGPVPKGTHAEGAEHLEKAVALAPDVAAHRIELGFAYLGLNRREDALRCWKEGLQLPSRERHDETSKMRARLMLERIGNPGTQPQP